MDRLLETEIYYPKSNFTDRICSDYFQNDPHDLKFVRKYQNSQSINWGKFQVFDS